MRTNAGSVENVVCMLYIGDDLNVKCCTAVVLVHIHIFVVKFFLVQP